MAEVVLKIVITAALLVAFALLLGVFAVFLWDLLQERTRGWLRVMLVVVLAPLCALAAVVVSAVAPLALFTALESDEVPAGLSKVPARSEQPADPETTSEGTSLETITDRTAFPSAAPSPPATPSPSPEVRHKGHVGHRGRR